MKSKDFKSRAREALQGNWFISIIAGLIATLLGGTSMGGGISFNVEYKTDGGTENPDGVIAMIKSINDQQQIPANPDAFAEMFMVFFSAMLVGMLIAFVFQLIIGSGVAVGYARFNLDLMESYPLKLSTVFSGFDRLKTAICANLLMYIRVLIGTVFFIIPGILMAYSYSMVNYVIADNPDMTAREALRESKRIMKGNRWRLFCLCFSFIGWMFLGIFTLGIALLWVIPYQQASVAAFYKEAKKNA